MILLSKIYTKGGDKGKTSLGDGERVFKNDPRIQAIGSIDELNAVVGLINTKSDPINLILKNIQNDLFDIGSDLCFKENQKNDREPKLNTQYIDRLETWIDHYNKDLPHLKSFVLPRGSKASTGHHMARTVTRRAERNILSLWEKEKINPFVLRYINRLSDLFFVLARYENEQGKGDILWKPGGISS